MSVLLKKIKCTNPRAAEKLERLELCTDSDLKSLTREDLQELFPGEQDFRMRKTIFETIHKQEPVSLVLKEMKDFIPDESLRAAVSNNGVLVDYLNILKEMKTQVNNVQAFLDAHISLLEDIRKPQPETKSNQGVLQVKDNSQGSRSWWDSFYGVSTENQKSQPEDPPQKPQFESQDSRPASTGSLVASCNPNGFSTQTRTIKYKMEISGNTLNAHQQILDRLQSHESSTVSLSLVEGSDMDSDVTLLFCPIATRAGTDIDVAMRRVKGDERVILILLRHSHEVKPVTSMRTWSHFPHVVLHVIVFYHETARGLLSCQENTNAISEIRKELLKHSSEIPEPLPVHRFSKYEQNTSYPVHTIGRPNSEKKGYLRSFFRN